MPDKHDADELSDNTRINRRSILKSAAASSVAFTTLPANVQASKRANNKEIQNARKSTKVRGILEELGDPPLKQPKSAQVAVKSEVSDEEIVLNHIVFFVKDGALVYTEGQNGQADAKFRFGIDREDFSKAMGFEAANGGDRKRSGGQKRDDRAKNGLRERYRHLPEGTDNMLIATESGETIFRRRGTDDEHELLRDVDGISLNDSTVVTGSDIDGFYVTAFEGDEEEAIRSETRIIADDVESVNPTRSLATQLSVEDLSYSLTTQQNEWYNHPCFGVCTGCGGSIGNCAACAPTCAGSPTGIGLFACAACLFAVCHGVLVATCSACADCLTDNPS